MSAFNQITVQRAVLAAASSVIVATLRGAPGAWWRPENLSFQLVTTGAGATRGFIMRAVQKTGTQPVMDIFQNITNGALPGSDQIVTWQRSSVSDQITGQGLFYASPCFPVPPDWIVEVVLSAVETGDVFDNFAAVWSDLDYMLDGLD